MAWLEKFANKVNEKVRETEEEVKFRDFEEVVNEERRVAEEQEAQPAPTAINATAANAGSGVNLKFAKPESYNDEEVAEIAEYLLSGDIVILDVEAMQRADVIRLLDFINGVTYVIDATITQKNQKTFVITPSNVNINN